jgi:aspartate-semialdehyde dehydrogenase
MNQNTTAPAPAARAAATLPDPLRVAVVGASSLIGEAVIAALRARGFPLAELHALDDARELGKLPTEADLAAPIGDVAAFDFARVELVFFCARKEVSLRHAEAAAAHAWVIDGSSAFRARADVPLIAADVNAGALAGFGHQGLIALPGSASVALATVLGPLHAQAGLLRVDVATYQAVSGSGRSATDGLAAETVDLLSGRKLRARSFGRQIAFNVIPQVDALGADGQSLEERRLLDETRRVLGLPALSLGVTAVRVPVFFGHSLAVHASFAREFSVLDASRLLQSSNGVSVLGADTPEQFPTPAELASAPDRVYVGRLRADLSRERSLGFWITADNVRKCAAYNAVSTAQILVNSVH